MSTNNWYYIDNTNEDTENLLNMFWEFHDFRIKEIDCSLKDNTVDVYLEYDSDGIFVLLRFQEVQRMHYAPVDDYDADWLFSTLLYIDDNHSIVWITDDAVDKKAPLPNELTWIRANKLSYAMVDAQKQILDIPDNIRNQVWETYNCETHQYDKSEHHFSPKNVL